MYLLKNTYLKRVVVERMINTMTTHLFLIITSSLMSCLSIGGSYKINIYPCTQ